MKKLFAWAVFYAAVALGLSCVDLHYVWYAPVYDAVYKTNINWFGSLGLHSGMLGYAKHDTTLTAMGWQYALHAPRISPMAIHAGGGLAGGSVFIAAWLAVIGACLVHLSWLAGAGKLRRAPAPARR